MVPPMDAMNTPFDFDTVIDRRGTHSVKWDSLEARCGMSPEGTLAMWVADMDFAAPPAVNAALAQAAAHGVHGYFGDDRAYLAAITGWMARRHGWEVDPEAIATTHGIVAGFALCLQAFTAPGEGVILFTPVYHAFQRVIRANGRLVVESPLVLEAGRYRMDLAALAASLTGDERMLVLCSPHNPGGRVWSREELAELADFASAHDLLILSDEIHHDLILPGHRHVPMTVAAPEAAGRTVMLTATTKTFNIAGTMTGNVIIPDPGLRKRFAAAHLAAGASPNRFGLLMATAAYETGDAWVDALCTYLAGNARVFDEGIHAIPGLRSMPLEGTYLAWVDFAGTGMTSEEVIARVEGAARIATSHGAAFGTGGEGFLRINLGTPRVRIAEAVGRLQEAFADLQ
jgi:cystathionine beta-lyase